MMKKKRKNHRTTSFCSSFRDVDRRSGIDLINDLWTLFSSQKFSEWFADLPILLVDEVRAFCFASLQRYTMTECLIKIFPFSKLNRCRREGRLPRVSGLENISGVLCISSMCSFLQCPQFHCTFSLRKDF